jgi:hypothetical protein
MKGQTERLHREFEDIARRGAELVTSLDDEALVRRPSEQGWSAGECIQHLSITAEEYVRRVRRVLDGAVRTADARDESLTFIGRMMVRVAEPPAGRIKIKTPSPEFLPGELQTRDELLARFQRSHAAMVAIIAESDAYDRRRLKVASPGSDRMKLPLVDTFSLLAAHARRHLWQAARAAR